MRHAEVGEPDPREARLPKWAQSEMERLRKIAREQSKRAEDARLATKPEESDTILDPWEEIPLGLGEGPTIRFRTGERYDDYIDVRIDGDAIQVMGGYEIVLQPSSGNVVRIRPHRY